MDLEVQVAADGPGVAARPDAPDALARADPGAAAVARAVGQVRVPVVAVGGAPVDDQQVAVEDGVVDVALDAPAAGGGERRAAPATTSKPSCLRPPERGAPKRPVAPRNR